jgi:ATP adenylyltransferase
MEQLWAPWRMEYIKRDDTPVDKCVLCSKLDIDDGLLVHKGKSAFVMMNLYPYNNGHIMISPIHHISDFDELPVETQTEIMKFSSILMRFMKKEMNAEGFNMGANIGKAGGAGIDEHFHLHIVPRWNGDTNFMPIIGHTKVQVDGLIETCTLLKKAF